MATREQSNDQDSSDEGSLSSSESDTGSLGEVLEGEILPYQNEPVAGLDDTEWEALSEEDESTDRAGNTEWCTCHGCEPMETGYESVCCQEYEKVCQTKAENLPDGQAVPDCICSHSGFAEGCLSVFALLLAYYHYKQEYGQQRRGNAARPLHKKYRYVAYRQFVRWCWHFLGKDIRIPLPSCVVTAIRKRFPNPNNLGYVGFKEIKAARARMALPNLN